MRRALVVVSAMSSLPHTVVTQSTSMSRLASSRTSTRASSQPGSVSITSLVTRYSPSAVHQAQYRVSSGANVNVGARGERPNWRYRQGLRLFRHDDVA